MVALKRKDFARWQSREKIPDASLCEAIQGMERGLIDADLGGFLYKIRISRPGSGKRGGHRIVLSARVKERYVFLHGFSKNEKSNITQDERKALQYAGRIFLELSPVGLQRALETGVLIEVDCAKQTDRIPAK
jgi:hypothetical protein